MRSLWKTFELKDLRVTDQSAVLQVDRLASPGALAEVKKTIQGLNAEAELIETVRCKIDLGQILNRGVFDPQSNASLKQGRKGGKQDLLPESHQEVLHLNGKAVNYSAMSVRALREVCAGQEYNYTSARSDCCACDTCMNYEIRRAIAARYLRERGL